MRIEKFDKEKGATCRGCEAGADWQISDWAYYTSWIAICDDCLTNLQALQRPEPRYKVVPALGVVMDTDARITVANDLFGPQLEAIAKLLNEMEG